MSDGACASCVCVCLQIKTFLMKDYVWSGKPDAGLVIGRAWLSRPYGAMWRERSGLALGILFRHSVSAVRRALTASPGRL